MKSAIGDRTFGKSISNHTSISISTKAHFSPSLLKHFVNYSIHLSHERFYGAPNLSEAYLVQKSFLGTSTIIVQSIRNLGQDELVFHTIQEPLRTF